jgi:L-fuconolactonase
MLDRLSIVDSHVHLWDPGRFRMPWLDDIARLRQPFDAQAYAQHTRGVQVESVVYIQVDVTPAYALLEARWAAELGRPVDAIVAFAPIEDGAIVTSYLDALARIGSRIKGVRRLLQSVPDPDFLVAPGFLAGLRLLPTYGWSFDICIRHSQLERTTEMARACPQTDFILDHFGKPDVAAGRLDPWREQLAQLAELPNVVCKLSGLITEADHAHWTVKDLEPYVSHALAVFGEDRVLFGSDWPVVTLAATYGRWVEALSQLTTRLAPRARQKLWSENARRVYRL